MKKLNIDFKNLNWKKIIISALIAAAASFLVYYIFLPPINPHSVGFWVYLSFVIFAFSVPYLGINLDKGAFVFVAKGDGKFEKKPIGGIKFIKKLNKIALIIIAVPVVIAIIGGIFSSTLFFAKSYASVIDVDDTVVFEDDMPETTDDFTYIALMDTESAQMLGNRELG